VAPQAFPTTAAGPACSHTRLKEGGHPLVHTAVAATCPRSPEGLLGTGLGPPWPGLRFQEGGLLCVDVAGLGVMLGPAEMTWL